MLREIKSWLDYKWVNDGRRHPAGLVLRVGGAKTYVRRINLIHPVSFVAAV
jgi:hypothetical protein